MLFRECDCEDAYNVIDTVGLRVPGAVLWYHFPAATARGRFWQPWHTVYVLAQVDTMLMKDIAPSIYLEFTMANQLEAQDASSGARGSVSESLARPAPAAVPKASAPGGDPQHNNAHNERRTVFASF